MFDLVIDLYSYVAVAVGAIAVVIFTFFDNSRPGETEKVRKRQAAVFLGFFIVTMALLIWLEPPPPPFWLRD